MLIARRNKSVWRNVLIFAVTTLLVLTPLIITALTQWDMVMGRPGDVSIFNPAINHGDPIGSLVRSTASALGMFFWRGDRYSAAQRALSPGLRSAPGDLSSRGD